MGRNFKPSAILEAKGAYLLHPERAHPNEPTPTRPLGAPPKWLSETEKKVWKDLVKQVCPGVLMFSDRDMFEMLVVLTAQFRARAAMTSADKSLMVNLCSRFAMTPADRSRVSVDKPKDSKLDAFINRKKKIPPPAEPPLEKPADPESVIN